MAAFRKAIGYITCDNSHCPWGGVIAAILQERAIRRSHGTYHVGSCDPGEIVQVATVYLRPEPQYGIARLIGLGTTERKRRSGRQRPALAL